MSDTPKPCPFCGSAPEVTERADWHTSTKRICFVVCMCGGYTAHAHQHGDTRDEAIAAWNTRAKPEQSPSGEGVWVLVTERLPEPGVKVIAYYLNGLGHHRRIRAEYVAKHSREDNGEFQGDTDDTDENSYWPEGWYESNEHEEVSWRVDDQVTHWQPLPKPPASSQKVHVTPEKGEA